MRLAALLLVVVLSTMAELKRYTLVVEADELHGQRTRVRFEVLDDDETAGLQALKNAIQKQSSITIEDFDIEFYDKALSKFSSLLRLAQLPVVCRVQLIRKLPKDKSPVLALPYKQFGDIDFEGGEFKISGVPLYIGDGKKQCSNEIGAHEKHAPSRNSSHTAATGLTIWDGSIVLAKFLEHHNLQQERLVPIAGNQVVEVGSGTGLGVQHVRQFVVFVMSYVCRSGWVGGSCYGCKEGHFDRSSVSPVCYHAE